MVQTEQIKDIIYDGNRIIVNGRFGMGSFHFYLATAHRLVTQKGYQDLILDFSQCTHVEAGAILPVCAVVMGYRNDGINVQLTLPLKLDTARLFTNANWAHLLDPDRYEPSSFRGYTQVPATCFTNAQEQFDAVDNIMKSVLGILTDISREDLGSLEWSLNEITDNVIVHSESPIGGIVQLTTFQKHKKRLVFAVCDAGISIPRSLRSGGKGGHEDTEALDYAIREGATRDKAIGQGNGLFGSYQISCVGEGSFQIHSGHARLLSNVKNDLMVRNQRVPFDGTLILNSIDYSHSGSLAKALQFKGRPTKAVDMIEMKYESEDFDHLIFIMKNEARSFGSREAGLPLRKRLFNLYQMFPKHRIFVDFTDLPIFSSSFIDEVFGKLFVELGPMSFMSRFEFTNMTDIARGLLDRALMQRSKTGA